MSRYIATRAIRGANALVTEAEWMLRKVLAEKGPDTPVAFPNTAYYLPLIYGMTGQQVETIGQLEPVLTHARELLHPVPAPQHWTPYLGETLDSGMATLLAAETIEAIRFVYGLQPEPISGFELAGGTAFTSPDNGKNGADGHLNGPIDDIQLRSWGIQLVDGRMPGFAAIVGAAKSNEVAVKIVRELQRRNILCFLSGNVNGRSIIHQLLEEGVELGYDTYTVPFGTDTLSAVYALGFAVRSALTFGGMKGGMARDILLYNKERVFAFVLALGEVDDLKYAAAAGAINFGFPVIADTVIPEILPTGITTYEHVVSMPFNEIAGADDLERAEQLVQKCIEVRGVKVRVANVPVPVPYGSAFEGEVVRKADMRIEFGGKNARCFEYLHMAELDDVTDGKIEVVGPTFEHIEPQGKMDLGIVVKVAGRQMQADFEPVLERQIHYFVNGASGIQHIGQRDIAWIRISNAAADKGFNLEHFGKILHARLHADFGAIVDKVQVTLYTDPDQLQVWLARARESYDFRNKRLADLTDDAVEEFYSCTLCQSFAPDHVCIVSPERLGLCGAYNWLDCKASFNINPTGPNQPIKLGTQLDLIKGYWSGINNYAKSASHGTVQEVTMYSIMENPMTACLTADAEVIIDGKVTRIGEWVETHHGQNGPFEAHVWTLNEDGKVTPSQILGVHRNPAPPFLVQLETKSGQALILTPNHPVAVDRPEGQVWARADEVAVGDRVYAAQTIPLQEQVPMSVDLLPDSWRIADEELVTEIWEKLETVYGSRSEACRTFQLPYPRSSWPISLYSDVCTALGQNWTEIKSRIRHVAPPGGNPVQLLPNITPELLYLLGFLASDGSLNRLGHSQCQVFFTNTETDLLDHVEAVYHQVFSGQSLHRREKTHGGLVDGRTIVPTRTGYDLYGSNSLLGALANALGVRCANDPRWDLKRLFDLPQAHIAAFIAGVFDGDGSVRVRQKNGWFVGEVYLCHSDESAARHLALLLRRLGIVGHVVQSHIFKVVLHGADLRRFASLIVSHHPQRAELLAQIQSHETNNLDKSQTMVLPYASGRTIAQADSARTLSTSTRYYYTTARSRPVRGNAECVMTAQPDTVSILKPLLEREDFLDTVTKAAMIENNGRYDSVYNLSLLDINSYLANGLLVKNCGCFECIVMLIPEANGVMVVSREDTSMTPAGMTFSTLAGMAGGGMQTPGVMGVGKFYLISPKFISADGGFKRVVWMSSVLKETMADELQAAAEREGDPDLINKIADEREVTSVEDLLAWLEAHNHPALIMDPIF
jgi:acetyl-CoA synthase